MEKIKLSLAPIAGFSDQALRTLCIKAGADEVYTEMISAKAVCFGDQKTHALAFFQENERPIVFQLFGREPERIGQLVKAMVSASPARVSVKLRTGIDETHKNALTCALVAEHAGAGLVTVHGRTRAGMFSAPIDYDTIKEVNDALTIPVCANGGITDLESAKTMIERTGCLNLMIARGAL